MTKITITPVPTGSGGHVTKITITLEPWEQLPGEDVWLAQARAVFGYHLHRANC